MATRSIVKLCWASLLLAPFAAASESATETTTQLPKPDMHPKGHTPEPEAQPWSAFEHVTPDEFNKAMKERDYNLVAFVDPKIFDSEILEWHWPFIKDQIPNNYLSVDCTAEVDLCLEQDVRTYPSLRLYRNGNLYARYRGPKNGGEIVKFVQRSLRPVVGHLDEESVKTFPEIDDVVFILHMAEEAAARGLYRRFHELAAALGDRYTFAIVGRDKDNSVEEEGENAPTVLRCYNNLDKRQAEFDGFFTTVDGLSNFVQHCGQRLVKTMTLPNAQSFIEGKRAVLYYFDADRDTRAKFADDVLDLAKQYEKDLDIVVSNPLQFGDIVHEVGLPGDSYPAMAFQNPRTMQMMLYTHKNIDVDVVARFISDGLSGSQPMMQVGEMKFDEDGRPIFGGGEQEGQEEGQQEEKQEEQAAPRDEL